MLILSDFRQREIAGLSTNGGFGAHISHMNNPSIDDIDKPGGWLYG
jgi:hypothetical protein